VLIALVLHLTAPAAHAANVTTQVKSFEVQAPISATCFASAAASVLVDVNVSSAVLSAAINLLTRALSSVVVDFAASGTLQIQRHGANGAVFHVEWGASLTQTSLAMTSTNTTALATALAAALATPGDARIPSVINVPRVGGSVMVPATAGGFVSATAATNGRTSNSSLATALNLATVDAMNITEARSSIVFTSEGFASAKADIRLLEEILTTAASLNNFVPDANLNPAEVAAAVRMAAEAVTSVLANISVQTGIEGNYKAMSGPASKTDLLEVNPIASVRFQCNAESLSTLTVTVRASALTTP
jgi:hypothetical protein